MNEFIEWVAEEYGIENGVNRLAHLMRSKNSETRHRNGTKKISQRGSLALKSVLL